MINREIDLNDMVIFQSVAELGSFTKAADVLGLPKSNISRKVTRLEQQLNVRLLERSTRSMHLTEIGNIFLKHCQRISEELEHAQYSLESLSAEPSGTLKICTSVGVGQGLLGAEFAHFMQRYPRVKLDIKLTNRRVDILEEGFDLAIRVGQSPDSSLISKKLYQVQFGLFASPQYLKNNGVPTEPFVLTTQPCLFMSSVSSKPIWYLTNGAETVELSISPSFAVDDFLLIKSMLMANAGIALMPTYLCQREVDNGQLIHILPNWRGRTVDVYAIYPSRKGVTPKLRSFLTHLTDNLSN